ncbi:GlxA family transcriptional regulator [Pedobacter jejuensis]|uniref:Helix-turn-helix domain-containing protein n=1 Tax=Pedobacter jejuensis TaxID=1268550 RepID=A0A3N0BS57_9SPHI|nr:helix-turn-helix domain-containing protein [Pedobacter jejuensis]RNL51824.1 helix-turn-helix domain-containing protein [Pedobacter jejuensis]
MMNVSIFVPEHAVMQAIADPQYLFSTVNNIQSANGLEPLFNIKLVGINKVVKVNGGLFSVNTTHLLKDSSNTDLIIIPALFGDMKTAIAANKKALTWIKEQYNNGAEVASLCVGAFLLASTGLLDGKKCSTHWGFQDEFREMFPNVEVIEGSIITEESRIYSSGGANSYWNLLLHLVEKYTNRQTAILASKYFAIDIDRQSQSAFAMFQGQKNHNDDTIKKAQKFIEENIEEKITIEALSILSSMGRRSFERRFKSATRNSVLQYINRMKIELAKRNLETSRKNINEVMYDVGYTDTKAFRSIFKKITGLTPMNYRNKYNKMAVAS